jgi:hypothetical protein
MSPVVLTLCSKSHTYTQKNTMSMMCHIRTKTPSTILSSRCSLLYISFLHLLISILSNFLFI